jgi:hypothetical protein
VADFMTVLPIHHGLAYRKPWHQRQRLEANRACIARFCARCTASPNAWYAGVHGRWGSSPRPRAIHSHTVLSDTPASLHAAVKVAPRASAMVIITCTVTFSFGGRPRACVRLLGLCKFGIFMHGVSLMHGVSGDFHECLRPLAHP